jgi:hypothetical protein
MEALCPFLHALLCASLYHILHHTLYNTSACFSEFRLLLSKLIKPKEEVLRPAVYT